MKLLDKLKNALFEEEYVEVEEVAKPKKKEKVPIAKKIELPERKKEIVSVDHHKELDQVEPIQEFDRPKEEIEPLKPEGSFKFSMPFEEEDFVEENIIKETETLKSQNKAYGGIKKEEPRVLYQAPPKQYEHGPYEKKVETKVFRPSPIISPIYGVLDRNYKKEEIVPKKEVKITSYATKMDLDAVREKAYGDLTKDFGLSMDEAEKEAQALEDDFKEIENNLLFDMRDEQTTPAVNKVTIGDAEEYFQDLGLEYNIDYKDASKEKATGRRVQVYEEQEEIEEEEEDSPVVEQQDFTANSLEDNLFDLIDSMYEEKE